MAHSNKFEVSTIHFTLIISIHGQLDKCWRCSSFGQIGLFHVTKRLYLTSCYSTVSLSGFGPYNTFAEFTLELPDGWFTKDDSASLFGLTQKCYPDRNDVVHLSCPFNFNLYCEKEDSSWPQILIKVNSFDTFGFQRVEGYGAKLLPRFPGTHRIQMETFREVPNSPLDMLSLYFLGLWQEDDKAPDDQVSPHIN